MPFPTVTTDRLHLRAPDSRDEPAMLRFLESEFSQFWGGPFNTVDGWARFASLVGQWPLKGYGMMAITLKDTGQTIGMAGPYHPAGFAEPEMSWLLCDPSMGGKGFAAEACTAQIAHEFATRKWPSMVSFIHEDNRASIALAKRLGATLDPDTKANLPGCITYRHSPTKTD